ncbi:hypothetical protein FN846DRAFT_896274 [Sphaerosporella brunnea]|uniref:Uncharacterized protein n=1 Tax=Sphaerosporella brunnea TaxID=1250544 RepID=A0A5J5ECJ1_9PEZI|nr:hypothetical protein FN846DRAFT_896274 [Sphaerosporella brunnea]
MLLRHSRKLVCLRLTESVTVVQGNHHGQRGSNEEPIRAAQTGVYISLDDYGFKASFGVKRLTDIDKQPVENSDIQVKNARLSGPITLLEDVLYGSEPLFCQVQAVRLNDRILGELLCTLNFSPSRDTTHLFPRAVIECRLVVLA